MDVGGSNEEKKQVAQRKPIKEGKLLLRMHHSSCFMGHKVRYPIEVRYSIYYQVAQGDGIASICTGKTERKLAPHCMLPKLKTNDACWCAM